MSTTSHFRGFFGLDGKSDDKKRVVKPKSDSESGSDSEERRTPEKESMTDSSIRQNFPVEIEKGLNKQINLELQACYAYESMGIYFSRPDVALLGFAKFFIAKSEESNRHAIRLMRQIIKRGGLVAFLDIAKPDVDSWGTGLEAMQAALEMKKSLNEGLLELHKLAIKHKDPQTERFLKKFLCVYVVIIKIFGQHVTNLKRVGPGLGVYMFGKKTLKGEVTKDDSDSSDSSDSDSDN